MKKFLWLVVALATMVLVGCSNNAGGGTGSEVAPSREDNNPLMKLHGTWESNGYLAYTWEGVSFKVKCTYTISDKTITFIEDIKDSSDSENMPNGIQEQNPRLDKIDDNKIYIQKDNISFEYKFEGNALYVSRIEGLFFGPLYRTQW